MTESFTPDELSRLRWILSRADMLDRLEIRETIERYFLGIRRQDAALLASAFTDDAEAFFEGPNREPRKGGAAIAAGVVRGTSQLRVNHAISSMLVTIDGDRANADTYCTNGVLNAERVVEVRGLQYVDDLVRKPEGWRIQKRTHNVLWEFKVPATRGW